jgi:tetratricopeptide (TPR) repeat protein
MVMSDIDPSVMPTPSPEHRRIASGQFERANQVLKTGNFDYAIQLLLTCCKLDPANLVYRQALRRTEKLKFKNNLRGSRFAALTNSTTKTKLKAAKASRDYWKVLECGEEVLVRNPWDVGAQMDMAEAADALGLIDLAVWTLEQARQKDPHDATINRALARLCEKRGNLSQAINLWELVRKADPRDIEAQHKAKDLAASDTIARGNYHAVVNPRGSERRQDEPIGRASAPPSEETPNSSAEDREPRQAVLLRSRLQDDPTNSGLYLQLAAVYRRAGKLDRAQETLEAGLGPTGNHFELALELADLEIEPFRRDLEIADENLRADPQDEHLRRVRIRLLKEINRRELDLYRQKSERFPTEMVHRLELGIRLLRAGQVEAAILELQAARTDPRQRWRALFYLGHCFKSRNNWRLAERNFEEALQNVPVEDEASRKELLFQLAHGCAETGDLAKAVDLAYELANMDFGYRDIGRLLDEWQTRLQKA